MENKKEETGAKSGFLDKFFGQAALPLMLYAGARAGLHESAREAFEWAVQLGRDGYERMRRAYMHAAPGVLAKVEFGFALFCGFILSVAWQMLGDKGGLCEAFLKAMAVLVIMLGLHAAYLWVMARPRFLRNDEGMLIRDEHGNRVRDPNSLYSPRAFSLRFSAALIAVTGAVLALGLLFAGMAYESRPLLVLSIVSGAVTLAILCLIVYIVLWALNTSVEFAQSGLGLTREQLQVLAAGYTIENVPRGPARIVDPKVLNRGAGFALELITGAYLTQFILQFGIPGWGTFFVSSGVLLTALAAGIVHGNRGGGLTVTDAAYRSSKFLFKWAPIAAFAILMFQYVLPEDLKVQIRALIEGVVSLAAAIVQFLVHLVHAATEALKRFFDVLTGREWSRSINFLGGILLALLFLMVLLRFMGAITGKEALTKFSSPIIIPLLVLTLLVSVYKVGQVVHALLEKDHPSLDEPSTVQVKVPDGVTPDENGDVWRLPAAKPAEEPTPPPPPPSEPAVRTAQTAVAKAPPAPPKKLASKEEWRCSDALIAAIKRRGLGCAPPCVPCD
jgi:hypothetical protein